MPTMISKIILIILFTLMVFNGVYNQYKMQDDIAKQNAFQVVSNFVNNVRTKGYISPTMIEDFERDLQLGSYLFKTEFKHQKKYTHPSIQTQPIRLLLLASMSLIWMNTIKRKSWIIYLRNLIAFQKPNGNT